MKLTLVLNCQDRYLKLQEVHAFAVGDVYNPLVLDFADLPMDRLSSVDVNSLSIVLSHDGATVASASGFSPVEDHSKLFRAVLPLVSDALAEWFTDAGSSVQTVHCEVSDALNGAYASCEVPIVLRKVFSKGSTAVSYYTADEIDALFAASRNAVDTALSTKQDVLTVGGALAISGGRLTIATAHGDTPGVVSSPAGSTDTTGMRPCVIVNGVPYYEDYDSKYGPAGYDVFGLVRSGYKPPQEGATLPDGAEPCPIVNGIPFYILPKSASSDQLGLVTTTSDVTDASGLTPCPIIDSVPYYCNTTYPLAGGQAGLIKNVVDTSVFSEFFENYYSPCPVKDGVPYYLNRPGMAGYNRAGLVRSPVNSTDTAGCFPCRIVDGVPYYRNDDTTYGPATRQTFGLVRTKSFVDTILPDSGYLSCPIVDGVPYYRNTTYPTASLNVLGLVKTSSNVTDVSSYSPCPIVGGVPYHRDTTYPVASTNVLGVVKTTSDVTDVSDYKPCPIVDGVPYYRSTMSVATASYNVYGLVKTTTSNTNVDGMSPCPIVGGVPYYRNDDTTYGSAGLNVYGLVKTTSLVTSTSGYTACPIIGGVPYYYSDTITYGAASKDLLGLVKTTSSVTDVANYDPCPIVDGVPYYAKTTTVSDLSYAICTTSSATMQDRAMNRVTMTTTNDVQLVFPAAVAGRARDFVLLVIIPSGTGIVGRVLIPADVSCLWAAGESPLANDMERDELDTVYYQFYFTEFDVNTFRVSRVRLVNS